MTLREAVGTLGPITNVSSLRSGIEAYPLSGAVGGGTPTRDPALRYRLDGRPSRWPPVPSRWPPVPSRLPSVVVVVVRPSVRRRRRRPSVHRRRRPSNYIYIYIYIYMNIDSLKRCFERLIVEEIYNVGCVPKLILYVLYFCWEVFMFRTLDLLHDFEMQLLVVF